ncbi:ribonuclease III [Ascobolus immersus RN42]|uniref:Ribonuclease III n=1 Tax=Ascobolus immersus RN42 TaxID=1160509 RepID=A0A3N4IMT2_ASCIM|nr:ribonuclease III [Ascobolus immersus RN42]
MNTDWYKSYPIPTIPKTPLVHTFHDKRIETRVFTHKSLTKVGANALDNEGLEWLGDRILKTFLGILLFKNDPSLSEGAYTEVMGALENNEFFAHLSDIYGLSDKLLVGANTSFACIKKSIIVLGGLFEAYVGGVYLDKVATSDEATALHYMIEWLTPVFEPYLASYKALHTDIKLATGLAKMEVAGTSPIMTKVKDYILLQKWPELEITTTQLTTNLSDSNGGVLVNPWRADLYINGKTYRAVEQKKRNAITSAYKKAWEALTGESA